MSKTFCGIDIGSFSIKIVIAEIDSASRLEIIAATKKKIQRDFVIKGKISNVEGVSRAIETAIKKAELTAGNDIEEIIVSISSESAKGDNAQGTINIPEKKNGKREVQRDDILRAFKHSQDTKPIRDNQIQLHVLPQKFITDGNHSTFDPAGMLTDQLATYIHIVAVEKQTMDSLENVFSRIGYNHLIKGDHLEENAVLQSLGAAEVVTDSDERELGCLVIDIGEDVTDYIFFHEKGALLTGGIPLAGGYITLDLARVLGLTVDAAVKFKEAYGSLIYEEGEEIEIQNRQRENIKVETKFVAEIIEARLEEIFSTIKKELITHQGVKAKINQSEIIITGGTSHLKGIKKVVEKIFHSQVRIGHPIMGVVGKIKEIDDPTYSTVVGIIKNFVDGRKNNLTKTEEANKEEKNKKGFLSEISNRIKNFFN